MFVPTSLSEDGKRYNFRKVVFCSEFETMDKVQKPSNPRYKISSESFTTEEDNCSEVESLRHFMMQRISISQHA
jgi:hypothetical protein